MTINQYFNLYNQESEKELISDLHAEAIQLYGFDLFYLPRTHVNLDNILGEDPRSEFTKAYQIEMYLKSVDSFANGQDFLSKFGLELRDAAIFTVARKTFKERTFGSGLIRPKEGDLLYFPLVLHNNVFEIRYVEDEKPFYQDGGLYVWDLKVEMFEYANEKFRTGVPEIDAVENRYTASAEIIVSAGSGNYAAKEFVYQGDSLAGATFKAEVITWSSAMNLLKVKYTFGELKLNVDLKGNTSGTVRNVDSSTLTESQGSTNDPFQDNTEFQEEGETVVDFDPLNPFGGK